MFSLIWAAGDSCLACGRRQPLGIEAGDGPLTARCLACGARFIVELTNQSEGTRQALLRLAHTVLAARQSMAEVNRQTDLILRPADPSPGG